MNKVWYCIVKCERYLIHVMSCFNIIINMYYVMMHAIMNDIIHYWEMSEYSLTFIWLFQELGPVSYYIMTIDTSFWSIATSCFHLKMIHELKRTHACLHMA